MLKIKKIKKIMVFMLKIVKNGQNVNFPYRLRLPADTSKPGKTATLCFSTKTGFSGFDKTDISRCFSRLRVNFRIMKYH